MPPTITVGVGPAPDLIRGPGMTTRVIEARSKYSQTLATFQYHVTPGLTRGLLMEKFRCTALKDAGSEPGMTYY